MDKLTCLKKISKFWNKWKKRPLCLLAIVILYCCQFIFFLSLSNALAKSGFKLRLPTFKFNKNESQRWKNKSRPISGNSSYFIRFPYDTREKYYWNTLDNRDFLQLNLDNDTWISSLPVNTSMSTWRGKLIEAEKRWRLDKKRDGEVATFECPEVEKIGNRRVCGFYLYSGKQQPEECIMMTFGEGQWDEVEGELEQRWLSETKCRLIMYEFDEPGNETMTKLTGIADMINDDGLSNTNRLELFPKVNISDSKNSKKTNSKSLNSIMHKLGTSWIDILILKFKSGEGKEFSVLDQILKDFKYNLPFAQLFVDFHFPNENCTGKRTTASHKLCSFEEKLVRRGLRPFHRITIKQGSKSEHGEETMTNQTGTVVRYSFLNLKGKHLLLVGKDELA